MQIEQVTSAEALGPLLDAARAEGRCAIDTEFVWERTYAPGLCLVQIATAERLAVVDPVEGAPLEPVAELMADPAVEKVCTRLGRPARRSSCTTTCARSTSTTRSSQPGSRATAARCRSNGCSRQRSGSACGTTRVSPTGSGGR